MVDNYSMDYLGFISGERLNYFALFCKKNLLISIIILSTIFNTLFYTPDHGYKHAPISTGWIPFRGFYHFNNAGC